MRTQERTAPKTLPTLIGCRDMLRECAKQLRAAGECDGHARMAEMYARKADVVIAEIEQSKVSS